MKTMIGHQEFLTLVERSGLIQRRHLEAIRRDAEKKGPPRDTPGWATMLVHQGYLSKFHVQQLLKGKWRGFFLQNKYKLLELIGSGGMGKVFLAEHLLLGQFVAIKILPENKDAAPGTIERFYREARASISLNHPHIVRAFDVDKSAHLHYLVMEFVDGRDLDDIVATSGGLNATRAANYIRQAALGLQHAHEHGWVHRDVKPGNLLLDRTGQVKLVDLGLARLYGDRNRDNLTMDHMVAGTVLGTANYLAPEQAISTEVDIRADIYSLGASLYFLLAGKPPFAEGTITQKLIWLQTTDPIPIETLRPDMPRELAAICKKMMAKQREQRFATPAEVVAALDAWRDPPPPPTPAEIPPSRLATYKLGLADAEVASQIARDRSEPGISKLRTAKSDAATDDMRGSPTPSGLPSPVHSHSSSNSFAELREPPGAGQLSGMSKLIPPPSASGVRSGAMAPPMPPSGIHYVGALSTESPSGGSLAADAIDVLSVEYEESFTTNAAPAATWKMALALGIPALVVLGMIWQMGLFRSRSEPVQQPPVEPGANLAPWYVTRDGSHALYGQPRTTSSLAQALAQAKTGERIVLLDAVHEEALSLEGARTPKGIIIEGREGERTTWQLPVFKTEGPILKLHDVGGITFRRLRMTGSDRIGHLIAIQGSAAALRFEDIELDGYRKEGVRCEGVLGMPTAPVRFDQVTWLGGRATAAATAIRFPQSAEGKPAWNAYLRVRDGLVVGPQQAAFAIDSEVADFSVEGSRFFGLATAVHYAPRTATLIDLQISNCTFGQIDEVFALDTVPIQQAKEGRSRCLLAANAYCETPSLARVSTGETAALTWLFAEGRDNVADRHSLAGAAPLLTVKVLDFELPTDPAESNRLLRYAADSDLARAAWDGKPVGAASQ